MVHGTETAPRDFRPGLARHAVRLRAEELPPRKGHGGGFGMGVGVGGVHRAHPDAVAGSIGGVLDSVLGTSLLFD